MRVKLGYEGEFCVWGISPLDELDESVNGRVVVGVNLPDLLVDRIWENRVLDSGDISELVWPYLSDEDRDRINRGPPWED